MKQTKILFNYLIVSFTAYAVFLIYYHFLTKTFFPFWFSGFCFLISTYSILRGILFHGDSSLWFGLTLFFTFCVTIIQIFVNLNFSMAISAYLLCPALSSTIIGEIYNIAFHFTISFTIIVEVFLILLYNIKVFDLKLFCFFSFILFFLVISNLSKNIKETTRKKE